LFSPTVFESLEANALRTSGRKRETPSLLPLLVDLQSKNLTVNLLSIEAFLYFIQFEKNSTDSCREFYGASNGIKHVQIGGKFTTPKLIFL
jgi:hypothetical protein